MKDHWSSKALKDVCVIKPPKREVKTILRDDDLVSFVPMEDLPIDRMHLQPSQEKPLKEVAGSYTYFRDQDVLLAKITPCFENGKLGIARNLTNTVGFGSSEYIVYRPSAELTSEYLYYFLSQPSFREYGASRMQGAVGHKRIPKEVYEDFLIPIPPLPEQKRIVAILDEAFEAIDKAKANVERNLENAKELFQSKLVEVLSSYNDDGVSETLNEVCLKITDGTHQTPTYYDTGITFLSSRNVTSKVIDWQNIKYIDQEQHVQMQKRVSPKLNDILLAKNGTTGVAAIVDRDIPFDIYVSLALLRPSDKVLPSFLLHFINSPLAKRQFNKRLKGIGVPNLHLKEIREVELVYPESLDEQEEIVAYLDEFNENCQSMEANYRQKLYSLEELKKSILQKAFNGEL